MVTRIIRNKPTTAVDTKQIDALLKSISDAQDAVAENAKIATAGISELYTLMKKAKMDVRQVGDIKAILFRPSGRSSTVIDPVSYRKAVKDDKEFYGSIKVAVTEAKKVLPEKVLATISTVTPAVAGEETVKVSRG